jgi:hypothetical protein
MADGRHGKQQADLDTFQAVGDVPGQLLAFVEDVAGMTYSPLRCAGYAELVRTQGAQQTVDSFCRLTFCGDDEPPFEQLVVTASETKWYELNELCTPPPGGTQEPFAGMSYSSPPQAEPVKSFIVPVHVACGVQVHPPPQVNAPLVPTRCF